MLECWNGVVVALRYGPIPEMPSGEPSRSRGPQVRLVSDSSPRPTPIGSDLAGARSGGTASRETDAAGPGTGCVPLPCFARTLYFLSTGQATLVPIEYNCVGADAHRLTRFVHLRWHQYVPCVLPLLFQCRDTVLLPYDCQTPPPPPWSSSYSPFLKKLPPVTSTWPSRHQSPAVASYT